MKNRYLVTCDLDDTLLDNEKNISEYSLKYIKDFISKGNIFALSTGRPYNGSEYFLTRYNINLPLIASNGSIIIWYDNEFKIKEYKTFPMDLDIVRKFCTITRKYVDTGLATCAFKTYSYNYSRCPFWILHNDGNIATCEGEIENLIDESPIALEFYVNKDDIDKYLEILNSEEFINEFDYINWGMFDERYSIGLIKNGINKGSALLYLKERYNIDIKNTFAFGDQLNDLPMITVAEYGVAMINSREEVRNNSKYISKYSNLEDGVIKFLEEYIK